MTGTYDVGQEGTGAASNGWRGVHVVETGFIRQCGYKEMQYSFFEEGLWAVSKVFVPVFSLRELSLWNQNVGSFDARFTLTEAIIVT
jgi:hypothetical protein